MVGKSVFKIHDRQKGMKKKLLPLELKTGRPTHSVEHKGQVTRPFYFGTFLYMNRCL